MGAGDLLTWWGIDYLASPRRCSSRVSRAKMWGCQSGLLGESFDPNFVFLPSVRQPRQCSQVQVVAMYCNGTY